MARAMPRELICSLTVFTVSMQIKSWIQNMNAEGTLKKGTQVTFWKLFSKRLVMVVSRIRTYYANMNRPLGTGLIWDLRAVIPSDWNGTPSTLRIRRPYMYIT